MSGNRRAQRNGYQRTQNNGFYDEFPLEVREFLEIVEGIARRMLSEKGTEVGCERSENCLRSGEEERNR